MTNAFNDVFNSYAIVNSFQEANKVIDGVFTFMLYILASIIQQKDAGVAGAKKTKESLLEKLGYSWVHEVLLLSEKKARKARSLWITPGTVWFDFSNYFGLMGKYIDPNDSQTLQTRLMNIDPCELFFCC